MQDTGDMSRDHVGEPVEAHVERPEDHASGHGSSHGHGHEVIDEPLGPPDFAAWAYAVTGGLLGLVTALAMYSAARG
jgi:hypothetical protein